MMDTEASSDTTLSVNIKEISHASLSTEMNSSEHSVIKKGLQNEQEQMQNLNLRLTKYIETVHLLQMQNHKLVMEIEGLKGQKLNHLSGMYEEELNKLRKQMEVQAKERSKLEVEMSELRERLQEETLLKEKAKTTLTELRMKLDAPVMACKVLEKNIKILQEEKEFQAKIFEKMVHNLQEQIKEMKNFDEVDTSNPKIADILSEMKKHYDDLARMNKTEAEKKYKSLELTMNQKINLNIEELNKARQEISELTLKNRKHIREFESLRVINDDQKKQIKDMEKCHKEEVSGFQNTIIHLKAQVTIMTDEKAQQKQKYENLRGAKAQLDEEIAMYRKLLEGEEGRIKPSKAK